MNIKDHIVSQYSAALQMLEIAIKKCPTSLWIDDSYTNSFWHIAYHTLFYTDLYLSRTDADFKPWSKHLPDYNALGPIHHEGGRQPKIDKAYSKEELLAYYRQLSEHLPTRIEETDLEAPSGFDWLAFNKLELQFYNIRHLQHHAGQLVERIRENTTDRIAWVRMG